MEITIGADPEFFLFDSKIKNHISGHNILRGSKEHPYKLSCGGALQRDGLAGEFNIQPAHSLIEFKDNISCTVMEIEEIVGKISKSLKMDFSPLVKFEQHYFNRIPAAWKVLGCEPDFINDSLQPNNPSQDVALQPVRTAGGHIHLGWREPQLVDDMHLADCLEVVKNVLYNIKVPEGDKKLEEDRRKIYGKGVAWRAKPYGLEFRSPSNHWVKNEITIEEIYTSTKDAWNHFISNV